MPSLVFSKYANQIQSLNVKITNGVKAPHKAIMLITIIDMIHKGELTQNKILLENDIAEKFKECWNFYVDPNPAFSHFTSAAWTPFWHLKKEPFWHFCSFSSDEDVDNLAPGQTASIGKMRSQIWYAYFDTVLFDLLQNSVYRNKLRELLFTTYIYQGDYQNIFGISVAEDVNKIVSHQSQHNYQTIQASIRVDTSKLEDILSAIKNIDGVDGIY